MSQVIQNVFLKMIIIIFVSLFVFTQKWHCTLLDLVLINLSRTGLCKVSVLYYACKWSAIFTEALLWVSGSHLYHIAGETQSKCTLLLQEEDKPVLHVYNAVTRETIPIMGSIFLLTTTVSSLKSLVSLKCGLPVSMFRLSTQWGVEIYSCNKLDDYKMDAGMDIFNTLLSSLNPIKWQISLLRWQSAFDYIM